jgi:hypothetical protein
MTPRQTLKDILHLTETLVGLSLSNEQNFPATHGNFNDAFEITVNNASNMNIALKNIGYHEIYTELDKGKCFNVKMLDGALLSLRYRFNDGKICEHSLSYMPSPSLELFQNDPELYLDDEIYADILAKNIIPFPVRFDFCDDPNKFVDVHHPYSHMTLGQYTNCRIPVSSPVDPLTFGGFILRNFYNTAFRKFSVNFPTAKSTFEKTISINEQRIPHIVLTA